MITIDGMPIERINRQFLRQNIAMVLQDTHLFTGTVRKISVTDVLRLVMQK